MARLGVPFSFFFFSFFNELRIFPVYRDTFSSLLSRENENSSPSIRAFKGKLNVIKRSKIPFSGL